MLGSILLGSTVPELESIEPILGSILPEPETLGLVLGSIVGSRVSSMKGSTVPEPESLRPELDPNDGRSVTGQQKNCANW